MIKVIRESDTRWMVWNRTTNEVADIVRIFEGGYLGSYHNKPKYRVDYKGKTIDTMIPSFQSAKSVATKAVK